MKIYHQNLHSRWNLTGNPSDRKKVTAHGNAYCTKKMNSTENGNSMDKYSCSHDS
jgi:hypothetical protein